MARLLRVSRMKCAGSPVAAVVLSATANGFTGPAGRTRLVGLAAFTAFAAAHFVGCI